MSEKDTTLPKRELIEEFLSHYSGVFSESTLFYLKNYYVLSEVEDIACDEDSPEYERCIQEGIFTKEEADKISDMDSWKYDEGRELLSSLLRDLSERSDWSHIKFEKFNKTRDWNWQHRYLKLKKEGKEIELDLVESLEGASEPGEQPYIWLGLYLEDEDKSLFEKIQSLCRSKDAGYEDPATVWSEVGEMCFMAMSVPLEKGVRYEKIEEEFNGFLNKLQAMADDILNLKN